MSERKIVVPDGMLDAAHRPVSRFVSHANVKSAVEAALRWLSENPIVPTPDQAQSLYNDIEIPDKNDLRHDMIEFFRDMNIEWQRRMFLAPEPEFPPELADMMELTKVVVTREALVEAFHRGRKAGGK